jgi:hypothetical protein
MGRRAPLPGPSRPALHPPRGQPQREIFNQLTNRDELPSPPTGSSTSGTSMTTLSA